MSLFLGPMHHFIPGHKDLTDKKEILHVSPSKEVYIPLAAGANTDLEVLVQEGDKDWYKISYHSFWIFCSNLF